MVRFDFYPLLQLLCLLGQIGQLYSCFLRRKLRIAISHCIYSTTFPQLQFGCSDFIFSFSVAARKLSMTGSIRNFENLNFTPKSRIFVSLKVKLPNMTDCHILPGLEIDFLVASCRLSVNPRKPNVAQGTVPVVIYRSLQQT